MAKFILLIREDLSRYPLPDQELSEIIKKHSGWARDLANRGIFIDGNGMPENGYIIEKKDNMIATNPIRDIKEGIGGYYIIEVENIVAAVEIAKECPTFEHDKIEVRPLM